MPALLGGIFKADRQPVAGARLRRHPVKLAYEGKETQRFVKRHGLTAYRLNPHFPVNTLQIMRGAVAAQQLGVFEPYVEAVYPRDVGRRAEDGRPGGDQAGVRGAGLPAEPLIALTADPAVKAKLIDNTEAAVARGVFGTPSFLVGDELFFGKDRLRDVEEEIVAPPRLPKLLHPPAYGSIRSPFQKREERHYGRSKSRRRTGRQGRHRHRREPGHRRGDRGAFRQEGAKVIASARTAEEGESKLSGTLTDTINRITKAGGEARFVKADLASAKTASAWSRPRSPPTARSTSW